MPDDIDCPVLNVADIEPISVANGPGKRFVIWVQGCPFRCPGCSNDDFLEFKPAQKFTVSELYARVVAEEQIEGVTFSGGEPMAQAHALSVLAENLKAAGLSVVCFSGFSLEELRSKQETWQLKLLSQIDVLIDGRYNRNQPGSGLRGSTNQNLHFLSGKYNETTVELKRTKTIELASDAQQIRATGVWDSEIFSRLNKVLEDGPRRLISLDEQESAGA